MKVEDGNIEVFPLLKEFIEDNKLHVCSDNMIGVIVTHIRSLLGHFKKYFTEETTLIKGV